jgi:hypothetical protein
MRRIVLSIALAVWMTVLYASPAPARPRPEHHAGNRLQRRAGKGAQKQAPILHVTFGFSISNAARDIRGEVGLKRMAPNTSYRIAVFESPAPTVPCTPVIAGTLTTDGAGNGNRAIDVERIPGSTIFIVSALSQERGSSSESPAVELG